jgi:hypothetical protein
MIPTGRLRQKIAEAIRAADSSYFNEDYNKQADAALRSISREGFTLLPQEFPPETWKKVAENMRLGKLRPEEHAKDVYDTLLRVLNAK